jgi:hypothetical protein
MYFVSLLDLPLLLIYFVDGGLCPIVLFKKKSPLLLYLSASNLVVSVVLVQEKEEEGKLKQLPVNFASEALSGSKLFYFELEKIAYVVIMAVIKLRHYFEGLLTVKIRQPSHEFTFGVGMSFIPYPLVLTPVV